MLVFIIKITKGEAVVSSVYEIVPDKDLTNQCMGFSMILGAHLQILDLLSVAACFDISLSG